MEPQIKERAETIAKLADKLGYSDIIIEKCGEGEDTSIKGETLQELYKVCNEMYKFYN